MCNEGTCEACQAGKTSEEGSSEENTEEQTSE